MKKLGLKLISYLAPLSFFGFFITLFYFSYESFMILVSAQQELDSPLKALGPLEVAVYRELILDSKIMIKKIFFLTLGLIPFLFLVIWEQVSKTRTALREKLFTSNDSSPALIKNLQEDLLAICNGFQVQLEIRSPKGLALHTDREIFAQSLLSLVELSCRMAPLEGERRVVLSLQKNQNRVQIQSTIPNRKILGRDILCKIKTNDPFTLGQYLKRIESNLSGVNGSIETLNSRALDGGSDQAIFNLSFLESPTY